jgi:hypothetical protein
MSNRPDEPSAANSFAGFGKFVPGFDFLQNLVTQTAANAAKTDSFGGSSGLQMPGLGGWIAPTLNVEELDRRIKELKAVQFWLDQNATALKATVTALEVQKMTLATLKDMNFNMNEVASAFKAKATEGFAGFNPTGPATSAEPGNGNGNGNAFSGLEVPPTVFRTFAPEAPARPGPSAAPGLREDPGASATAPAAGGVDPMQWWGALTQQFQTIAADAMKDVARQAAQVAPQQAWPTPAAPVAKKPQRASARAAPVRARPAATSAAQVSPPGVRQPARPPAAKPAAKRAAPVAAKSGRHAPLKAPAKKVATRPVRTPAR